MMSFGKRKNYLRNKPAVQAVENPSADEVVEAYWKNPNFRGFAGPSSRLRSEMALLEDLIDLYGVEEGTRLFYLEHEVIDEAYQRWSPQ